MATFLDEQSFMVLPPAARTASPAAVDFTGVGESQDTSGRRQDEATAYCGLVVVVDVTATAATTSTLTVSVQGVDPLSGKAWDIVKTAALSAAGTVVLRARPGLTAGTGVVSDVLPPTFRVSAVHSGAESFTYSVSGHLTY